MKSKTVTVMQRKTILSIRKPILPFSFLLLAISILFTTHAIAIPFSNWSTVANGATKLPGDPSQSFFSFNQPSINDAGLVVFRGRAKATSPKGNQGGMTSGIFSRDMSQSGTAVTTITTRGQAIPAPNNIEIPGPAQFNEFPSIPRIDAASDTIAFRGQSQPSWNIVLGEGEETRSGTAGIYVLPDNGPLTTGSRNIEPTQCFPQYLVPGENNIRFEQYPGSPSPTGSKIVYKGNWTDATGKGKTGVFYRDLQAENGQAAAVKIAQRGDDIPVAALPTGMTSAQFGSTAPPSAAEDKMVFTGLDNEDAPTAGGIFLADLVENSALKTMAGFRTEVPGNSGTTLSSFGEALSFDGRYVGFWAGWGSETIQKTFECGSDGNRSLLNDCRSQDDNGTPNDGIYSFDVIVHQGIFLADTVEEELYLVAQTGDVFEDFLFWHFSGKPSDAGEGDEGESARWRNSSYLAVDGDDIVFKAQETDGTIGLYGALDVTSLDYDIFTLLSVGMDGGLLDAMATGLPISELSLERDGFRNGQLAISASMDDGENSRAGIYIATVPEPSSWALFILGAAALTFWRWHKKEKI